MQRSTTLAFFGLLATLLAGSAAAGAASLIWKPPEEPTKTERSSRRGPPPPPRVEMQQVEHAFLGVTTVEVDGRCLVEQVNGNSAAERAGIRSGDLILSFEDSPVTGPEDLGDAIRSRGADETVTVKVLRAGETLELTAKLGRTVTTEVVTGSPTKGGSLTGRITDESSGHPVPGADVRASVSRRRRARTAAPHAQAKTDADGKFAMEVAASTSPLELIVEAEGFVSSRMPYPELSDVTVALERDGRVRVEGMVRVAATGKPVRDAGATVRASRLGFLGFSSGGRKVEPVDGKYVLRLEPGRYDVIARGEGLVSAPREIDVKLEPIALDFELAPADGAAQSAPAGKSPRR